MVLKIIGTAVTGIGGHYLNKRWDKAILFLCLFILYAIVCWVTVRTYLFSSMVTTSPSSDDFMQQLNNATSIVSIIYLSGIIILWGVSIVLTIVDGRKTDQVPIFKWTKIGVVAASLTTLFSFLLLVSTSITSAISLNIDTSKVEDISNEATVRQSSHNFYDYLYIGGNQSDPHKLPEPPEGQGVLSGQILYDNKPAEGIKFDMVLNSKYRARNIITDANGFFTIKLPIGNWKINSIQTESWKHKPDGDRFTMYYGGEAKLIGDRFDPYSRLQRDGYQVAVNEDTKKKDITIVIKKDIEMIWPDENVRGDDGKITDTIRWKPYPMAEKYYIQIKHLRREGTTTYYDNITSRVLSNETSLPLNSIKHVKSKEKKDQEYSAEIYAFSNNGTLIGQHSDTFRGGTFVLTDGHMFIEEKLQSLFDSSLGEDTEMYEKKMDIIMHDRRRIDAVETLIEDDMVSEAEALLKLIDSELAKGRKEVLSGYIMALKGNCHESKRLFDEAMTINPTVCIPEEYRAICK